MASYDQLLIPESYNNRAIIDEGRKLNEIVKENAEQSKTSAESALESEKKSAEILDTLKNTKYLKDFTQTETSTESGGENEWTATYSDDTAEKFKVYNGAQGEKGDDGVGIEKIEQTETSTKPNGINKVVITLTNGKTSEFQVRNGSGGASSGGGSSTSIVERNHNIPRLVPKDITEYYTDGTLWDRIHGTNGFSLHQDIFVGDYIKMSRPIYATDEITPRPGSEYVVIAGITTFKASDMDIKHVSLNYEHLVMVPIVSMESCGFGRGKINAIHYLESGVHELIGEVTEVGNVNGTINQQLYAEFGEHLKTKNELILDGDDLLDSFPCQAMLMSDLEFFGYRISNIQDFGNANIQLPLFAFSSVARHFHTWLKNRYNNVSWCGSIGYGLVANSLSYLNFIAPRFIIA